MAPEYPALFAAAFGNAEPTGEHTLKAISTFLCTLVSADSKYDRVQRGEAVFNEWESHGYQLSKRIAHPAIANRFLRMVVLKQRPAGGYDAG
jgi:cytochrome c peroxidase